jgi:enoyl-CoA hydratase/carnithine racemase
MSRPRYSAPAVLYEKHGSIAVASLNRPGVHNAYNVAMRDALFEVLGAVRDDPDVGALVLRGNGPSFCSGGDVSEFGAAPSIVAGRDARWRRDVWGLMRDLPQPVIVAAHGHVAGGGFEMALLADLCIAANDASFWYPETGLGMIPGVAGTQTTPRLVGVGRALELMLVGRRLPAQEACRLGLVSRVVQRGRLQRVALSVARHLCRVPKTVAVALKRAVNEGLDLPLSEGLALEARLATALQPEARSR